MNDIGTKILTLRKNKHLTQAQLAEALSVTPQSISKWENQQSAPDLSLLPMIARFFGITMDELFGFRLDALNRKERFIRLLADNGALQFGRFTLNCGRTSPYYINTSHFHTASQLTRLGESYAECLRDRDVKTSLLIANTANELPLMVATSTALYQHYGQDTAYSSGTGIGKAIMPEDRLTLIKDTLTTGRSLTESLNLSHTLTDKQVTDVIISVDRMERSERSPLTARRELERRYGIRIHAIVTLDDLISAMESHVIGGQEYLNDLKDYKAQFGGRSDDD